MISIPQPLVPQQLFPCRASNPSMLCWFKWAWLGGESTKQSVSCLYGFALPLWLLWLSPQMLRSWMNSSLQSLHGNCKRRVILSLKTQLCCSSSSFILLLCSGLFNWLEGKPNLFLSEEQHPHLDLGSKGKHAHQPPNSLCYGIWPHPGDQAKPSTQMTCAHKWLTSKQYSQHTGRSRGQKMSVSRDSRTPGHPVKLTGQRFRSNTVFHATPFLWKFTATGYTATATHLKGE